MTFFICMLEFALGLFVGWLIWNPTGWAVVQLLWPDRKEPGDE